MYEDYLNCEVVIIISARTDTLWEYTGTLCDIDATTIKLKNVEITQAMLNVSKNMFGTGIGAYKKDIDEIILNKNYIISCHKK